MGLMVDLRQSRLNFLPPRRGTAMSAVGNVIHSVMHRFSINFSFGHDARRGVHLSSSPRSYWQIGIVQNVIFEYINFEYQAGAAFSTSFNSPVLDSSAIGYVPFYHDPVRSPPTPITNPRTMQTHRVSHDLMIPVRNIFYTPAGMGELLNPWHGSGVSIVNRNFAVDILDEPSFGAKLRRGRAVVVKAEHIIAFQTWLIAKNGSQTRVLAHVSPFSLVFWVTTRPRPGLLSIGTPSHQSGFYGTMGVTRRVRRGGSGTPARVRIASGAGGRRPVLQGQTANDRALRWLRDNNLTP